MLGHHQPASETPFTWRFAGRPMMAHIQWYLDPHLLHYLGKNVRVGPPLTKLSGSAHVHHIIYLNLFSRYILIFFKTIFWNITLVTDNVLRILSCKGKKNRFGPESTCLILKIEWHLCNHNSC